MINLEVFTAGCPTTAAGAKPDRATRIACAPQQFGEWLDALPARLAHDAVAWWPWLLFAGLLAALSAVAVQWWYRWLWQRAVAQGYWVRVTPPRTLHPGQAGHVWRLLAGLARRARSGRHLTHPPLAFEVYSLDGGRLDVGLWLPGWVPLAEVVKVAGRAWPGVRVEPATPPRITTADGERVAGCRLAVTGSDLEPLTDPPHPAARGRGAWRDDDLLASVLDGLSGAAGPAVLQVLVRPATGKRLAALGHAARYGVTPRKSGRTRVVDGVSAVLTGGARLVLDVITDLLTPGPSTLNTGRAHHTTPDRRSDPVATRAIHDAGIKLADRPHLLATVRVAATGADSGEAGAAARSTAEAFITVSRVLQPVRLRQSATRVPDRWASRGDWMLCTATELDALAHIPSDPARYGFDTAALTRTPPTRAQRARPEHGTERGPGWTRRGWTNPPDEEDTDDDGDDHDGDPDDWQATG